MVGADRDALRFMGVGFGFLVEIGVCAGLGYWVDGRFGTTPWLFLAGVLIGMTGATWTLLKTVQATERGREWKAESKQDRDQQP